jgi:two-component system phosphate regulon sensor histidine kinase PhoR
MRGSLKRIAVPAIVAAIGLILLQVYWITQEWKTGSEIIHRQLNHAVQQAVLQELEDRKDSLERFLKNLLEDSSEVSLSTFYSKPLQTWTIKLADANNPADFTNFSVRKIPVDSILSTPQRKAIIDHLSSTAVSEQISRNTIMYYTQRFGKRWSERFDSLSLNVARFHTHMKQQLSIAGIKHSFEFTFTDTSRSPMLSGQGKSSIVSMPVGVQYDSVWDYDHHYVVQAVITNPFMLMLQKLWLAIAAAVVLAMLTVYYLFKMLNIIRNQKQLDELKNDFIDNMTHELKTPLATIHAAIDSLQYYKGLEDEHKTARYLNTTRKELARLNEMVDRILDISIYENQDITLHRENISLQPLVEEIAATLRLQYDRTLDLRTQCIPNEFLVYADKTHFINMITNLFENAVKYVPGNLQLTVEALSGNDFQIIKLSDNGPGIPASAQPLLFDKFYRVPKHNIHDTRGYGLGLYYVKQVVLQHGGTVSVKSSATSGTTFIIKLPAKIYA